MKLTKRIAVLLACTFSVTAFVGCKNDDDKDDDQNEPADNTGGTAGDGDGDTGNGDGDGDVAPPGPTGPQCDEPGGSQCTGSASGLVCADGSTDGVAFVCATGEVCDDGECVGQCEAGATECVGGSVQRVCTADGKSWVNIPCQNGDVCEDGECGLEGGLVCVPGAMDCDGNTARTCKDDGSGWDETACPGTTVCDAGACEGSVCTVGATKCDPSTTESSVAFFEGGVDNMNFGVVHRCVDGESWAVEACPSADGDTYCSYIDGNASDVAKLRAEVNQWVNDYYFWQYQMNMWFEDGQQGAMPVPPAEPEPIDTEGQTAACVAVPDNCELEQAFYEGPTQTRSCADPADLAEGEEWWNGYTECLGLMPYAPITLQTTQCAGASVCAMYETDRGCQATECDPGEARCNEGGTGYEICDFSGSYYADSVGFDAYGADCPDDEGMGGVGPGECTDVGSSPNQSVECNGEAVEITLPVADRK